MPSGCHQAATQCLTWCQHIVGASQTPAKGPRGIEFSLRLHTTLRSRFYPFHRCSSKRSSGWLEVTQLGVQWDRAPSSVVCLSAENPRRLEAQKTLAMGLHHRGERDGPRAQGAKTALTSWELRGNISHPPTPPHPNLSPRQQPGQGEEGVREAGHGFPRRTSPPAPCGMAKEPPRSWVRLAVSALTLLLGAGSGFSPALTYPPLPLLPSQPRPTTSSAPALRKPWKGCFL